MSPSSINLNLVDIFCLISQYESLGAVLLEERNGLLLVSYVHRKGYGKIRQGGYPDEFYKYMFQVGRFVVSVSVQHPLETSTKGKKGCFHSFGVIFPSYFPYESLQQDWMGCPDVVISERYLDQSHHQYRFQPGQLLMFPYIIHLKRLLEARKRQQKVFTPLL